MIRIFRATILTLILVATMLFMINRSDPWNARMDLIESKNFRVYHEPHLARRALELKTILEDRGLAAQKALGLVSIKDDKHNWYLYSSRESYLYHRYSPIERFLVPQDEQASEFRGEFFIIEDKELDPSYLLELYVKYLLKTDYPKLDDWMQHAVLSYLCWQDTQNEDAELIPGPDVLLDAFKHDTQIHLDWVETSRIWGDSWISFLLTLKPLSLSQILLAGPEYPDLYDASHDSLYLDWLRWIRLGGFGDSRKILVF